MKFKPRFHLCGTGALLLDVAQGAFDLRIQQRLWSLCAPAGQLNAVQGVSNVLLGVNNVMVTFDPFAVTIEDLQNSLGAAWDAAKPDLSEGRLVEIPVTYDKSPDSDLLTLAGNADLDVDEVIRLHTSAELRVACMGWVPGFAFMVGLPPKLVTPRRATPRLRVPKGSVGIGGVQTGVIPLEVPSGWNLIGLTDIELFSPQRADPCLLAAGDRVRFVERGSL